MKDKAYSFHRRNRLLSSAEFQPLFNQPDYRVGGQHLLLLVSENQTDHGRIGLVVGKRRVKHAVQRNSIRRISRESFRLRKQELAGLDIIILVKATIERVDKPAFHAELTRLWDKLLAKRRQA